MFFFSDQSIDRSMNDWTNQINQERVLVAARLWAGGIRAEYLATDALVR